MQKTMAGHLSAASRALANFWHSLLKFSGFDCCREEPPPRPFVLKSPEAQHVALGRL